MREQFRSFENLLDANENAQSQKDFYFFNLLVSITTRGEMFLGKHGAGLMTLAEFTKVVDEALQSQTLCFKSYSAAFLDESIDFGTEAPAIE